MADDQFVDLFFRELVIGQEDKRQQDLVINFVQRDN